MRPADRMPVVEAERQSAMGASVELVDREPFALHRVEHREVPRQHIAVEAARARDHRVEEIPQRLGQAVTRAIGDETHPAVDVPAKDQNRMTGPGERRAHRAEVLVAVDEERHALGALAAPAVAARCEQRRAHLR